MPTLADIYESAAAIPGRVSRFVQNPVTSLKEMVQSANERAKEFNELNRQATEDFLRTKKLFGPKDKEIADKLAEAYNPAGIFIGPGSAQFNKVAAYKAEQMLREGKTADEIWEATGTFKGPDNMWRQEISDAGLTAHDYRNTGGGIVLKHPELRKSYEELPSRIKISPQESLVETSAYKAPVDELSRKLGDAGTMYIPAKGQVPLDVYAHELQHAVQAKEGFARGGSPDMVRKNFMDYAEPEWIEYAKTLPNYKNQPTDKARQEFIESFVKMRLGNPEDVYLRLAGEAEARAVQRRFDMTEAEKKKTHPFKSYDVPIKNLIVKHR